MASIQYSKPVEQSHGKGHQEHSFTDKMKDMAHSVTKVFQHKNEGNCGQHGHLMTQKQHGMAKTRTHETHDHAKHSAAVHCPGTANTTTTHHKKEGHGHGGNFISNIGEHIKNLTSKKKHRKNKGGNCNDSGTDSNSSSDENDNEKKHCM